MKRMTTPCDECAEMEFNPHTFMLVCKKSGTSIGKAQKFCEKCFRRSIHV